MVCCFLDFHEMGVMPNRATCPNMDLRVSISVPQSESAYAESSLPVLARPGAPPVLQPEAWVLLEVLHQMVQRRPMRLPWARHVAGQLADGERDVKPHPCRSILKLHHERPEEGRSRRLPFMSLDGP